MLVIRGAYIRVLISGGLIFGILRYVQLLIYIYILNSCKGKKIYTVGHRQKCFISYAGKTKIILFIQSYFMYVISLFEML